MTSWRDVLKIHPAADVWPLLKSDKLAELADSIDANGMRLPIVIWYPGKKRIVCESESGVLLLDGRNRLDAVELLFKAGKIIGDFGDDNDVKEEFSIVDDWPSHYPIEYVSEEEVTDPFQYAKDLNHHRRHSTPQEQNDAIETLLKEHAAWSDRRIAEAVDVKDHKKVGRARKRLEVGGALPHHDARIGKDGVVQPAHREPPPEVMSAIHETTAQLLEQAREATIAFSTALSDKNGPFPITPSPATVEQAPSTVRPTTPRPVVLPLAQRRLMALIALDDDLAKIEARYESVPEFHGILSHLRSARIIVKELQHRPPPPPSTENMNFWVIEGDQQPDESGR
jgi:hypothetical protein